MSDAVNPLHGLPGLDLPRLRHASVLVAGAGNIGSHLVPLLARTGIRLLRLVDRDRVESKNLIAQDFRPEEVGLPKAEALARRIQTQFPELTVEAHTADLEDVPLGEFDVDLILGALDSRRARQALVSEIAWPLGVPVVDGGVGEGLVGRVQVFVPGPANACLECGWGSDDYRKLVDEYPCTPGAAASAPSTVSPAFAGAVVAGLMAAESVRILAGTVPADSQEIAFDLFHRRFLVSRLRRNARCRFDHAIVTETLRLDQDYASATACDLLAAVESHFGSAAVHLEWPRRRAGQDGFRAERFVSPESLRAAPARVLPALGLLPGDRIRVRSAGASAFLVLDP